MEWEGRLRDNKSECIISSLPQYCGPRNLVQYFSHISLELKSTTWDSLNILWWHMKITDTRNMTLKVPPCFNHLCLKDRGSWGNLQGGLVLTFQYFHLLLLWWLILCINLIRPQSPRYLVKHYFCIYMWACFWKRIAFESVDWVK